MRDKVISILVSTFSVILMLFGITGLAGVAICVKGNDRPMTIVAAFVVSILLIGAALVIGWLQKEAIYE